MSSQRRVPLSMEPPTSNNMEAMVKWLCQASSQLTDSLRLVNAKVDHMTEQLHLQPYSESFQVTAIQDTLLVNGTQCTSLPARLAEEKISPSVQHAEENWTYKKAEAAPVTNRSPQKSKQKILPSDSQNVNSLANANVPDRRIVKPALQPISTAASRQGDTDQRLHDVTLDQGYAHAITTKQDGTPIQTNTGSNETDSSDGQQQKPTTSIRRENTRSRDLPNADQRRRERKDSDSSLDDGRRSPVHSTEKKERQDSMHSIGDEVIKSALEKTGKRALPQSMPEKLTPARYPKVSLTVSDESMESVGGAPRTWPNFVFDEQHTRKRPLGLPFSLQGSRTFSVAKMNSVLKMKMTDAQDDNRHVVLKNTYNIIDEDETERSLGASERRNNQTLPPSGFKDEQGQKDNRFNREVHIMESRPYLNPASFSSMSNYHTIIGVARRGNTNPGHSRRHSAGDQANTAVAPSEETAIAPGSSRTQPDYLVKDDVLKQIIQEASDEAERCQEPKGSGLDTVICIDISESMRGQPLNTAKKVVHQLLNGIDENAVEHSLEENVALVTFGKEHRVVQHLTNDYEKVRSNLDDLEAGGPSPLWLGLALALTELKKRGGSLTLDKFSVKPRIILLSDGFVSQKHNINGPENNDRSNLKDLQGLLNSPVRQSVSGIDCVAVGNYDQEVLMAVSNDRIFKVDSIEYLIQYFRLQENANTLIKRILNSELKPNQLQGEVENIGLHPLAKKELFGVLATSLPAIMNEAQTAEGLIGNKDGESDSLESTTVAPGSAQSSIESNNNSGSKPSSLDVNSLNGDSSHMGQGTSAADEDDGVESPKFGELVRAKKDWMGYHTRQNFVGTVIGERKDGLVKLIWDDGTAESVRFGVAGVFDVEVVDNARDGLIKVGALVERGPDWRWGDQDGGVGKFGVVTKLEENVIHVVWEHGGQGNYRFGYNNKYDIKLYQDVKRPFWQVADPDNIWRSFPPEINTIVEDGFHTDRTKPILVKIQNRQCKVHIEKMNLIDLQTQKLYDIRRLERTENEMREAGDERRPQP